MQRAGQASFFYQDAHFNCKAVKVLPGEFFVDDHDILVTTTLGSCVAACLWDPRRRVGGMNHFMLPESSGLDGGNRAGCYGAYAMELLINELLARGATRQALQAKVFGGGAVIAGMTSIDVGERNTRFVLDYLHTEHIPVVSRDVQGIHPRKVCFLPASGRAIVKRLAPAHVRTLLEQDRAALREAVPQRTGGGTIDLF